MKRPGDYENPKTVPLGEIRLNKSEIRLLRRAVWQGAAVVAPGAAALEAYGLVVRSYRKMLRSDCVTPTWRGLRWWALYGRWGR